MKTLRAPWCTPLGQRLAAAGLVLIATGFLFRSHYRLMVVAGDSMLPTLRPGELLIVDERAYDCAEPQRGDIVAARYSGQWVVKRIVGLPGEEVEVRGGRLYVNGRLVKESHPTNPGDLDVAKGRLSDGDFATLGDNRAVPASLAVHPIVTKADILGKVVLALGKPFSPGLGGDLAQEEKAKVARPPLHLRLRLSLLSSTRVIKRIQKRSRPATEVTARERYESCYGPAFSCWIVPTRMRSYSP